MNSCHSRASYPRQSFYRDGKTNIWRKREDNGTRTLTGDAPMEDKSLKVRCTTAFSESGNKMTGKWEYSSDGSHWQTFWEVEATKID
jgi:hypothetical protein